MQSVSIAAIFAALVQIITPVAARAQPHDGAHDLDFSLGTWTVEIQRIADPFNHPNDVVKMAGTIVVTPIWGGKSHIEVMEVDGPKGHWEGMNLFLYNPQAQQWSKIFANSRTGQTESPLIGSFDHGTGAFYTMDTLDGRSIITRARWTDISDRSYEYDESYSDDGGKAWRVAFKAHVQRAPGHP